MDNTRYDYSPIIHREPLSLPNNARVAFWVGVNIEYFHIDLHSTPLRPFPYIPDVFNYSWRDYGARVGIWRIMEVLDRHGIRASGLVNAESCKHYPAIFDEGKKRQWEFVAHGLTNSRHITGIEEEEERGIIRKTIDDITDTVGTPPTGWLGPALVETFNTPDLLAEEGIEYVLDWCCDDQPFPMRVRKNRLISVPYGMEQNDLTSFLNKNMSGAQYVQFVIDAFKRLYAEGATNGRVMCIALHPFVIGYPYRIDYLDEALDYICKHDAVWHATSGEIAEWYYQNYYKAPA